MNANQPTISLPTTFNPGDQLEILEDNIDYTQLKIGDIVTFERYTNSNSEILVFDSQRGFKWYLQLSGFGSKFKSFVSTAGVGGTGAITVNISPYVTSGRAFVLDGTTTASNHIINGSNSIMPRTGLGTSSTKQTDCTCQTLLNGHHDECPYPKRNA